MATNELVISGTEEVPQDVMPEIKKLEVQGNIDFNLSMFPNLEHLILGEGFEKGLKIKTDINPKLDKIETNSQFALGPVPGVYDCKGRMDPFTNEIKKQIFYKN